MVGESQDQVARAYEQLFGSTEVNDATRRRVWYALIMAADPKFAYQIKRAPPAAQELFPQLFKEDQQLDFGVLGQIAAVAPLKSYLPNFGDTMERLVRETLELNSPQPQD